MTKTELVEKITNANVESVFGLVSAEFPALKIPLFAWVIRYYLAKIIRPMANEGTLFVWFKVIDFEQEKTTAAFVEKMEQFKNEMLHNPDSHAAKQLEAELDRAFVDAIRLRH